MTSTITITDVRRAVVHHVRALHRYGLLPADTTRVVFTEGSKVNGIAYRLHVNTATSGTGLHNIHVGSDFLGMTRREAFDTIVDRTRVVYDIATRLDLPAVNDWADDGENVEGMPPIVGV